MILTILLIKIFPNFVEEFILNWLRRYIKETYRIYLFSLFREKQTLEILLYFSFKVELPTNGLQEVEKLVRDHQAFSSYLGLRWLAWLK